MRCYYWVEGFLFASKEVVWKILNNRVFINFLDIKLHKVRMGKFGNKRNYVYI